jgi:hypothetical protein
LVIRPCDGVIADQAPGQRRSVQKQRGREERRGGRASGVGAASDRELGVHDRHKHRHVRVRCERAACNGTQHPPWGVGWLGLCSKALAHARASPSIIAIGTEQGQLQLYDLATAQARARLLVETRARRTHAPHTRAAHARAHTRAAHTCALYTRARTHAPHARTRTHMRSI